MTDYEIKKKTEELIAKCKEHGYEYEESQIEYEESCNIFIVWDDDEEVKHFFDAETLEWAGCKDY